MIISISSTGNSFLSFCGETQSRNSLYAELQQTRYTLLVLDFNCTHVPFSISIINAFCLQRYTFSVKHRKLCSKSRIFAKSFRWQSFRGIKESALLLVKSPNLNKEYTRHGAAHIRGLPIRVVYSGVWRYLQENTEGSPLSLTINIVISPSRLSAENSCKIRHYEKVFLCFLLRNVRNVSILFC